MIAPHVVDIYKNKAGESVENIKDVADVNAWSGNANSGNVNDLVNSFFVTPLVSGTVT